MANRVELNEMEMEKVAGGDFWYDTHTNEDGSEYMTCRVDNVGTFYCSANAKRNICLYYMKNLDATLEEIIQYALDNQLFWN